ncbi:MAG: DUF4179 domain-containing protein [Anaerolineaceae bacterium]|nr:DUF4179 domain-containing protein [Anaerolineaceae bacterium]
MSNEPSIQDLEKALERLFPQPDHTFLDQLENQLILQSASRSKTINTHGFSVRDFWSNLSKLARTRRWVVIFIGIFMFLAAGITAVGPQRVLAAVQGLIGYIPGAGFVQDSETSCVLAEPVSLTRDGVTVTVDEVVADTQSTRIKLHIEGIRNLRKIIENGPEEPTGPKRLTLLDGTLIDLKGGSFRYFDNPWMTAEMTYAPLPLSTSEVILSFAQIPGIPPGKAPEDWSLHLQLKPGSESSRLVAATPASVTGVESAGFSLTVESIAQMEGLTALKVRLNVAPELGHLVWTWKDRLLLMDAAGNSVPWLVQPKGTPGQSGMVTGEVKALAPGENYTLHLQGPIELIQMVDPEPASQFTFDPGPDPQIGQSWALDQTLHVAGHPLHLTGAQLYTGMYGTGFNLTFLFERQSGIATAMVYPLETPPATQRYGSGDVLTEGNLTLLRPWVEFKEMPSVPLTFQVNQISILVEGEWEVRWVVPK